MSVNNTLTQRPQKTEGIAEFKVGGETVTLSVSTVKSYLVSGDPSNVTTQEVAMFINLCKFQHLNPWLREAYLVKYGSSPATIVVGKDAIIKRAYRNAAFKGQQAGVVVMNNDTNSIENRIGSMVLPNETLVGGWAKVFVDGYPNPVEISVGFDEYAGRKKDGGLNGQWSTKPGTMIRKVALVQALREAFPEDLGNMYSAEETGGEEIAPLPTIEPEYHEVRPSAPVADEDDPLNV